MAKTVYYLGAGASYHALPLVTTIPQKMEDFKEWFASDGMALDSTELKGNKYRGSYRGWQEDLIKRIEELISTIKKQPSIDTYAKQLHLGSQNGENQNRYKYLKNILSMFLLYEQRKNEVDPRYKVFLTSIINDLNNYPKDISIISWNYDQQLAFALADFYEHGLHEAAQHLHTGLNAPPYAKREIDQIYHLQLNGTANFKTSHPSYRSEALDALKKNNLEDREFAQALLDSHIETCGPRPHLQTDLRFAWENSELSRRVISKAKEEIELAEAIVVIGYSFPYFNRTVDREIWDFIHSHPKVYIQCPKEHAQGVEDRLRATRPDWKGIEIKQIHDCEQFYLPNEL